MPPSVKPLIALCRRESGNKGGVGGENPSTGVRRSPSLWQGRLAKDEDAAMEKGASAVPEGAGDGRGAAMNKDRAAS